MYALLGLASISRDMPIQPDCQRSVIDVFCDAAVAIIEEDQNLNVLSQVHRLEDDAQSNDWPSWIPDWTTDLKISFLIDIENGIRPYDAGGKWTASYAVATPDRGGNLRGGWRTTNSRLQRPHFGRINSLFGHNYQLRPIHHGEDIADYLRETGVFIQEASKSGVSKATYCPQSAPGERHTVG